MSVPRFSMRWLLSAATAVCVSMATFALKPSFGLALIWFCGVYLCLMLADHAGSTLLRLAILLTLLSLLSGMVIVTFELVQL